MFKTGGWRGTANTKVLKCDFVFKEQRGEEGVTAAAPAQTKQGRPMQDFNPRMKGRGGH